MAMSGHRPMGSTGSSWCAPPDAGECMRDLQDDRLYGVTLKQQWTSSTYTDTGYVFLLLEFVDPDRPLIHVRSWQPQRFDDGSVISLQDFEIIRVD